MSPHIAGELSSLCQGVVLGGGLGLLYDGMRILRRRVPLPGLGGALDLGFWLIAGVELFLFSQQAWGGEIRLYGAAFCMLGGGAYFWGLSPGVMAVGNAGADILIRLLIFLTAPLVYLVRLLKRFKKIPEKTKKFFSFREK